jgi:hypothetical protein
MKAHLGNYGKMVYNSLMDKIVLSLRISPFCKGSCLPAVLLHMPCGRGGIGNSPFYKGSWRDFKIIYTR